MTELSENRRIKYVNTDGEDVIFDNFELLTSVDLAGFAQKAMERRLYHVAIDFAKESLRLHKNKVEIEIKAVRLAHSSTFSTLPWKGYKDSMKLFRVI